MPPETPPERSPEVERTPFESLQAAVTDVSTTLGPRQPAVSPRATRDQLLALERANASGRLNTFRQVFMQNELTYRRGTLARQAEVGRPDKPNAFDELVVNKQAITFYEYLPAVIQNVQDVMNRYTALRQKLSTVPDVFVAREQKAAEYMANLSQLLKHRISFANAALNAGRIAANDPRKDEIAKQQEQELKTLEALSPESARAIRTGGNEIAVRGNAINQQLIDLLAGRQGGVDKPKDVLPQYMYLDLLEHRFKSLLDKQKEIAADPDATKAQETVRRLNAKSDAFRAGSGPDITAAERVEFDLAQATLNSRNEVFKKLGEERRAASQELVTFTGEMGKYHLQMGELTTIQHLFQETNDLAGVQPGDLRTTPADLRAGITKNMQERRQFHMQRVESFFGVVDAEVLNIGVLEITEDFWNKNGREGLRMFSNTISKVFTFMLPENLGIRDRAREALSGPLNDALGWPPGKTKWADLTADEKATVQKRAESIKDAIKKFDRSPMEKIKTSFTLLRGMPKPEDLANETVKQPLPADEVTSANRDQLIRDHGAATVYMMIYRQIEGYWGEAEPPTGFMGQYRQFFDRVNANIDVHLDVGKALHEMSKTWEGLMWYLLAALAAIPAVMAAMKLRQRALNRRKDAQIAELTKNLAETKKQLEAERRVTTTQTDKIRGLEARIAEIESAIELTRAEMTAETDADGRTSSRLGSGPTVTGVDGTRTDSSGTFTGSGATGARLNVNPDGRTDPRTDTNVDVKKK